MDATRDYHTKWRKPDREKEVSYTIIYMWNLKKWYKCTYLQNRNRNLENKCTINKRVREKDKLGVWDVCVCVCVCVYTYIYIYPPIYKIDNQQ